ncbi:MAG: M42 family metallopeptidase [Caldicoprobacterales bacterium]|jgi:putative aminopeptidase FrvX|nr:M42 family metallopeptidase [Clostridiales bacterium]
MDAKAFLKELIDIPGVSGYEDEISRVIMDAFKPYCHEVRRDAFFNVYGKKIGNVGQKGPRIMLAAHLDEIGLMVKDIDDKGFISFTNIGGVDQRILLSQEVIIHGKERLYGVIGAKPPHLQEKGETEKAVPMDEMMIDVGLHPDDIKKKVTIGDLITFKSPLISLGGNMVCGKSIDDRAGVVMMLETMKELDKLVFSGEVYFVATSQEEVGTRGAIISTYSVDPDIGIAIDVTHGDTPDAPKDETHAMDKGPVIAVGPNMHPKLTERLMNVADDNEIGYLIEVEPGLTGTDARSIQVSREGVPTVLIELPLRYMHTTVETLNMENIRKASRLTALFIASMKEGWEECLTY